MKLAIVSIFAFVITLICIRVLMRYAERLGMVDLPGGRKDHEAVTPVVGGMAMFVSFVFSALFFNEPLHHFHSFLAGMLLLVIIGTVDDLHDLSARSRFIAQIMAGVFMVSWGGIYFDNLGALFGSQALSLGGFALPFTIFATVGVINAFNMIDGVDGLAGGLSLIALLMFTTITFSHGMAVHTSLLLTLSACVAAFLLFNLRTPWQNKARIFMGDAGSMMLGFVMIWFAVDLSSNPENKIVSPIITAWILAIPVIDTVSTMLRRLLKGQSPFVADREHLHHIFLRAGYTVRETVAIILFSSLIFAMIGLAGWYFQIDDYIMFGGFIALFGIHFMLMHHAWRFMKVLRKINRKRKLLKIFQ